MRRTPHNYPVRLGWRIKCVRASGFTYQGMNTAKSPPFSLSDGESVLAQSPARHLRSTPTGWGYNPINGTLFLTSQRLAFVPDVPITPTQHVVLKASGGADIAWFPLSRVTVAVEQPMKVQWGKPNVLKLVFDNTGREYFAVFPGTPGALTDQLLRAKATAPVLDFVEVPSLKPGFEQPASRGAQKMLLIWVLGMLAACVVCSAVGVLMNGIPK